MIWILMSHHPREYANNVSRASPCVPSLVRTKLVFVLYVIHAELFRKYGRGVFLLWPRSLIDRRIAERKRRKSDYHPKGWRTKAKSSSITEEDLKSIRSQSPSQSQELCDTDKEYPIKEERKEYPLIPVSKWKVASFLPNSNEKEPICNAQLVFHPIALRSERRQAYLCSTIYEVDRFTSFSTLWCFYTYCCCSLQ